MYVFCLFMYISDAYILFVQISFVIMMFGDVKVAYDFFLLFFCALIFSISLSINRKKLWNRKDIFSVFRQTFFIFLANDCFESSNWQVKDESKIVSDFYVGCMRDAIQIHRSFIRATYVKMCVYFVYNVLWKAKTIVMQLFYSRILYFLPCGNIYA